jgi:hypothetical protein
MDGALDLQFTGLRAALADATSLPDWSAMLAFVQAARAAARTDLGLALLEDYAARAPTHTGAAFALARLRYESGLDSAHWLLTQCRAAPDDMRLCLATASALAAEGAPESAEQLLENALLADPGWVEGHASLARLRWKAGIVSPDFARSFVMACAAQPDNRALRLGWFQTLALARDWEGAAQVIADGERRHGAQTPYQLARLFVASESGDDPTAEKLFAQTEELHDPGLELCRIRFGLRLRRLAWAEAAAQRLLQTRSGLSAWPYLSLIWRLRDDPRADWLDRPDETIGTYELGLSPAELGELSALLRTLHTGSAAHLDQSVRRGTQTDQPLFFRKEPVVQRLKLRIERAVQQYSAALPPHISGHPLLGLPRGGPLAYAGSWSVRLTSGGHHVPHTHPQGWISSAFYVALPVEKDRGAPPAGWIGFGTPPPELATQLAPYRRIEPKPGRLVLFPSMMWHATEPFGSGERLVIAFDIARAAAATVSIEP